MKVIRLDDYDTLSREAASIIVSELKKNKKKLLCAATGGSPTGTYEQLKQTFIRQPELFSELSIIKLDEWGGLPENSPATCEFYLQKHLIGPLEITSDRYISFKTSPENPEAECKRINQDL